MKKIKIFAILLALVLIASGLSACGKEKKETTPAPEEPAKLSKDMGISLMSGTEALLPSLPEGYKVTVSETREEVKTAILEGSQALAVVPTSMAVELYEESNGKILTVSPIKLGGIAILYYGMDREEEMTPADLSGRRIVTAEEGQVPQYVLNQAVKDDGGYSVNYRNVDNQTEVADALKEYNTYALVAEPYASKIMEEDSNVKKLMDIDSFWKGKGHPDIPTWVIVTGKWETEEDQDNMKVFFKDYQKGIDESNVEGQVFYGQSNRGDGIIQDFFKEILEGDKGAMGGKLPPDEMFYKMRFPT